MIGVASTAVECISRKSSAAQTSPAQARSILGRRPRPRLRHSVRRCAAVSAERMCSVPQRARRQASGAELPGAAARGQTEDRQETRDLSGGRPQRSSGVASGIGLDAGSNIQNRKYKKASKSLARGKDIPRWLQARWLREATRRGRGGSPTVLPPLNNLISSDFDAVV